MALTSQTLMTYFESDLGVDTSDMDDSTALFSSGIVDSFALVSLITFLEQECSIRMNPLDVNLDNLDSIERILEYVDRVVLQA